MAWTTPMTVVANQIWTATQFNTHVRDNLLETAPAKASTVGAIFANEGTSSIMELFPTTSKVATSQTTTSTSYTDLSTVGPSVTIDTNGFATVIFEAEISNSTVDVGTYVSVAVSGATTISADDAWCARQDGATANYKEKAMVAQRFTTLNVGSNTFTLKYRVGANTGTFANRHLAVIPL